jgi:DNA-binding NarL/FixJ family response regulator
MALLDVDRFDDAAAELERGLAVARAARREAALVPMRMASAFALTPLGRLDEAGEHAAAALEIARLSGAPKLMALATTGTTLVALRRGDLSTALAAGREGMAAASDDAGAPRAPLGAAWYAEALIAAGEPERAPDVLFAIAGGPELSRMEVPHQPLAYETLTRAAVALGDTEAARGWADRAAQVAAPLGLGSATAAALRARAHAYDDADAAREAADHAGPLDRARALLLAGRLSGDADLLQQSHDLLDGFGARRARDEAASELRALGHRVARPAARPAASDALAQLSPREAEVAALVHDRLTNRQIAERLVLSEKTIENHLARIFAKLQIRSRVELARAYERTHD